jgi:glycerol kinase
MNVLAIDQGTSATKALVVTEDGRLLGEASAPVTPHPGADGAVTQDPEELLESVLTAGRAAIKAAGGPSIDAVGLGNQGETVLRWDPASGKPDGPAISWQDRRAESITRALADSAERLMELSGLPLDPYFAAPKMAWLKTHAGDAPAITTIDAWVNHRLTGEFVTDTATASRTMLLDLDHGNWSTQACALFGLDTAFQPRIAANAEIIGETAAFGSPTPVSSLMVDQQAALFAESCFAPGEAKCTYGTGAFIQVNAGSAPVRSRSGLAACVAWQLTPARTYCLDGQVYSAGAALSWLRDVGLLNDPSDLDRAHGSPPPDPTFVPALAGLGSPYWAPKARAGWLGLSLASSQADLIDAVAWGIAAQIATLGAAVARDLEGPLQRLRADGGLTRSRRLMQAQADLLQVPVELYPSPDATARGVAALALLGIEATTDPAAAVGRWSPSATFEPQMPAAEAAERLHSFDAATRALIELQDGH